MREKQMEFEYKTKQLEFERKFRERDEQSVSCDTVRYIPLYIIRYIPPFSETDIDYYFVHFERVAAQCKWPMEIWTLLLQSVLRGKAQQVYSSLAIEQVSGL